MLSFAVEGVWIGGWQGLEVLFCFACSGLEGCGILGGVLEGRGRALAVFWWGAC